MRVLHLYSGNLYGGIERLLETLATSASTCPDLSHAFALCFEGRVAARLREIGAEVHIVGAVRLSRPWTIWQVRRRLRRMLTDGTIPHVDVAITHACWPHAVFGKSVRAMRLPLVNWVHDVPKGDHWTERWASRTLPDAVIANSRCTLSQVPRLFASVPAAVCYCPVPHPVVPRESRNDIRAALTTGSGDVVILNACRLERYKGASVLIKALTELHDVPNWVCWVAGGAQRPHEIAYLAELKHAAQTSGIIDRVRFLGQRSDVNELMAAADIHCQPNVGPEAFGIAFVEAFHARLPVVTSDLGAAPELVDNTCGRLVPPGDASALANALRSLILDASLRQQLGAAGPARAMEHCDPARVLAGLHSQLASFTGVTPTLVCSI